MKRFLSLTLAVLMVLTSTPLTVFGAQATDEVPGAIPEGVVLNYRDVEAIDTSFIGEEYPVTPDGDYIPVSYSASSNIPSSIVVEVKDDYVSPVKSQSPYGTCWAHAGISIAESSYIIDQNVSSGSVDYNEYHLAYYAYGKAADSLNLFGGDYNANGDESETILDQGGNNLVSLCVFAGWQGVSGASQSTYSDQHALNGVAPETIVGYSDAAHMENGYVLTMPDMSTTSYQTDMDVIKQAIMKYGSVAMSYYASSKAADYKTGYQYVAEEKGTNHAVTIVGWDDTIPAESFATKAPGDGAWLVKNSWGTWWGLGGYFWLSYYDATIHANAFAFDFTTADNYDNNYQYDGASNFHSATNGYYNQICGANAFVADSNETLEAVGIFTREVNTEYEIQIYRYLESGALPNTGTLITTQTGTATYAGFHTVDLKQSVPVNEGERYAVVVTLKKSGVPMFFPADITSSWTWVDFHSFAKAGESYLGYNVNGLADLNANNTTYAAGTNLRIKAFTNERSADEEVKVTSVTLDKNAANIMQGQNFKLNATVSPSNATNAKVTWSSNNSNIATVDQNGNVTGVAVGTAIITATAQDGSGKSAVCAVTVTPVLVTRIEITSNGYALADEFTISGMETMQLDVVVNPSNAENPTVKWTTSNANVATVDQSGLVTFVNVGRVTITATAQDGSGVKDSVIFINEPVLAAIFVITESEITLKEGESKELEVAFTPINVTTTEATWTSSNPSVATVDANGKVTAVSAGTAIITATTTDGTNLSDTCTVIVRAPIEDGLHQDEDGTWYYYVDGEIATDYTGLVEHCGGWFYVEKGVLNWDYTGLVLHSGVWFYVQGGSVAWDYAGLVLYEGVWFYVQNGSVQWGYTGLALHEGVWFYIENGSVNWTYRGLTNYNGVWFFVENGSVNWGYNSLVDWNGVWFYVSGGSVAWDYVGLVEYQGIWFYVTGGSVNWTYEGWIEWQGVRFYIKNGTVDWNHQ